MRFPAVVRAVAMSPNPSAADVIDLSNVGPQMREEWCHAAALIFIFLVIIGVEQRSFISCPLPPEWPV